MKDSEVVAGFPAAMAILLLALILVMIQLSRFDGESYRYQQERTAWEQYLDARRKGVEE